MNTGGVALVVGAGSGIGLETALIFAERGVTGVAFADKVTEAVETAAERSQGIATAKEYRAISITVDVTESDSVQRMVAETVKQLGSIDYFINSAGIPRESEAPIVEANLDEFDKLHHVNSKGVLNCLKEVMNVMLKQELRSVVGRSGRRSIGRGSIVNIVSIASVIAHPNTVSYTASKSAAHGITKVAAVEAGKHGVRVNAVCPAFVNTPMLDKAHARNPRLGEFITRAMPLQRAAVVEEVGSVAYFLASAEASFVNGQAWVIDSGVSLSTTRS